jgi:hypothetical protein
MTARECLRGDTVDVWFDHSSLTVCWRSALRLAFPLSWYRDADVRAEPDGGGIDLVIRLGPESPAGPAGSPVTLRLRFDGTQERQARQFAALLAGVAGAPAVRTIGVLAVALAPATGDWLSFGVLPDTEQLLGEPEG